MPPPPAPAAPGARDEPPRVTQDIAAEAAVWLARLHGPGRSRSMEQECLAWQARSAAHRLAFERCTDTWQAVADITLSSYATVANAERRRGTGRLSGWRWKLPAFAVSAALVLMLVRMGDDTYTSQIGEQRIVALPDGSRMSINTATRVRVDFSTERRLVKVEDGEVLFDVAKDAWRPFVVQVASTEVVATGTQFLVRYSPAPKTDIALAVTLVEGQVIVRGTGERTMPLLAVPLVMKPGQQVRVGRSSAALATVQLDRPHIDQALAWRRGTVAFHDATLPEAAAEANRYSALQITVDGKELSRLRVSGSYRIGDNAGFAQALAHVHGLVLRSQGDRLELASKQCSSGQRGHAAHRRGSRRRQAVANLRDSLRSWAQMFSPTTVSLRLPPRQASQSQST